MRLLYNKGSLTHTLKYTNTHTQVKTNFSWRCTVRSWRRSTQLQGCIQATLLQNHAIQVYHRWYSAVVQINPDTNSTATTTTTTTTTWMSFDAYPRLQISPFSSCVRRRECGWRALFSWRIPTRPYWRTARSIGWWEDQHVLQLEVSFTQLRNVWCCEQGRET